MGMIYYLIVNISASSLYFLSYNTLSFSMKPFSVMFLAQVKPVIQNRFPLLYCYRKRWVALVDNSTVPCELFEVI